MLAPYLENLICFIPFFMIHNRAVGSQYFAKLDAYLLYVLLFAIVYGQQQAIFSALLATAGYCFRQMYNQSGLEVLMDNPSSVGTDLIVGAVAGSADGLQYVYLDGAAFYPGHGSRLHA